MTEHRAPLIGGKTLEEWDRLWVPVEGGLKLYHPSLRYKVGLYRVSWRGQITALGTGWTNPAALRSGFLTSGAPATAAGSITPACLSIDTSMCSRWRC